MNLLKTKKDLGSLGPQRPTEAWREDRQQWRACICVAVHDDFGPQQSPGTAVLWAVLQVSWTVLCTLGGWVGAFVEGTLRDLV